ncbi:MULTISPECIES: ABC transporter ATP-binding protein [unclassified Romboutsia]|uniref:ABC transporter ATP-binding protein n=1 Tax=unclassified Romboutsia TaxID=2626894 RepID=UPI0008228A0F|nr:MULTISPECIES: ABC transporter ATP-binding protein [unclassified Romboutsia]SCH69848.1 sn-glycerol-3-phosphate import ATP-binding protein UgpC [uncultured Clostridium sp.]
MIHINKLRKVYDNGYEALKSINLEIKEGELICLLGPSGCGKTTILNLLAGLLDPTSGDIKFDNESIINKHPKDRNIGLVFQNYALYPHMTVLENVMFPLTVGNKKKPKEEAMKIAKEYMKITSIEELANKKPGEMSGGQQQRVAITRALVQNPKILLLDEPLSNLDARLRLKIREEIRRLVKEIGITTIFVTHDQEEALSISDRIVLMNQGIVQQFDIPQNLYLEPANLFVAKFMGNPIINIFEMHKEGDMLVGKDFSIDLNLLTKNRIKEDFNESKYIIGIRAEYFVVSDNSLFKAKIETVELIGKDCILNFKINNKNAKSITDINQGICEKDEVGFDIEYGGIYIFKEDGTRVY